MPADLTYDKWRDEQGIPVHKGYYIEDLRTVDVAPWSLRECNAAFIQLEGMQGVVEGRVQEIPPGGTIKPFKSAVDEFVYVLSGQGSTSVWGTDSRPHHSFEWAPRSLFVVPRGLTSDRGHTHHCVVARSVHPHGEIP